MRQCPPWLSQGDFFTDLPMPTVTVEELLEEPVGVTFATSRGPALLITYSSVIDKRSSKAQKPKATRLQFTPVHHLSASGLDPDTVRRLRNSDLNPAEAVYLDLGQGQEGVAFLGESYVIPTSFFRLESREFTGDPAADPADPWHVCATAHDTRALSMEEHELELLQRKMVFYYTRREFA